MNTALLGGVFLLVPIRFQRRGLPAQIETVEGGDYDGGDDIEITGSAFRGGKLRQYIHNAMGGNAGEQTAGLVESEGEQKAPGNGEKHLNHGFNSALTSQKVNNVTDAEGHGGNDDGHGGAVPF